MANKFFIKHILHTKMSLIHENSIKMLITNNT